MRKSGLKGRPACVVILIRGIPMLLCLTGTRGVSRRSWSVVWRKP
jgi:hypothetical protein